MKALSVRQPYAEAILRGVKSIEFRSRPTNVRGRVYVYATLGRFPGDQEAELLERHGIDDVTCDDLPRGLLIGTVELWDCTGTGGDYRWHLRDPERAKKLLKPTNRPQPTWFEPF
jgi:hypothetical protein